MGSIEVCGMAAQAQKPCAAWQHGLPKARAQADARLHACRVLFALAHAGRAHAHARLRQLAGSWQEAGTHEVFHPLWVGAGSRVSDAGFAGAALVMGGWVLRQPRWCSGSWCAWLPHGPPTAPPRHCACRLRSPASLASQGKHVHDAPPVAPASAPCRCANADFACLPCLPPCLPPLQVCGLTGQVRAWRSGEDLPGLRLGARAVQVCAY